MKKTNQKPDAGKRGAAARQPSGRSVSPYAGKPALAAPAGARTPLRFSIAALAGAAVFSVISILQFIQNRNWLILICCLLSAALCAAALFGRKKQFEFTLFLPVFAAFLLWMGISLIWASSGKFFLREFSKQLFALPLILFILFRLPRSEGSVRKLLFTLSAVGAILAILSIDLASQGLTAGFFNTIPGFSTVNTGFESGTRLTGILGNANILAGLLAVCVFFSIYLLDSSENSSERVFASVYASLQATTFVLNFSMGATGFFLLSVLVYLILAGKERIRVFLHMLYVALPSLAAVFLSFSFFEAEEPSALPLLCALLAAALTVILERLVSPAVNRFLEGRRRLSALLLPSLLLILCAYAAAGLLLNGPSRLSPGGTLRRSAYPVPGTYTLRMDSEGEFSLLIVSQNDQEVVMHTETVLYQGPGEDVSFTVPEGSRVVYLSFSARDTAVLRSVVLEGARSYSLHLDYPLLPGFIANRLQGLRSNENAIQRAAFFRDGMKVFRDHPIFGAGVGSFESLIYGYQEFHYQTKYVHNHYIQVLLDCGIIGFLLYAFLLILTLMNLWRGRKEEGPLRRLHAALCAAFLMLILHSAMEVTMSSLLNLLYGYAVLALISVCFGKPLRKQLAGTLGAAAAGLLSLVYTVLILLNMLAASAVSNASGSSVRMFSALERARNLDVFEKNDWMISYVYNCAQLDAAAYRGQAEQYADELMDVPSNSLHRYLIFYYLSFREYDKALQAAQRGASFNYSDSETWNAYFSDFADAFARNPEDGDAILDAVAALYDRLLETQERLMDSTVLDDASQRIISLALNR